MDVAKRKTAETKQSLEKRNLRAMATLGQDLSIQYSIRSLAADIQRHVKEEKAKIRPLTDQQISQKSQERAKMQKLASKKTAAAKPSSADTPGEGSMEVSASAKALTDAALDRLGNVKELLNAADSLGIKPPAGAEDALAKIEDGLKQIDALIGSVQSILNTYADIDVDPRSLIPSNEKLAASLLALEAERIKELAAIRAANALYLADLQIRLEYCVSLLDRMGLWLSNNSVESTLTASTNSELRYNAIYCLHLAAAGAAVNQTPFATEGLRESIAQRRYGIRRDGVYNGAYEQALQASAQRLSAYYAAGITKTQIAQLLYYLSGLVSLPKIAF